MFQFIVIIFIALTVMSFFSGQAVAIVLGLCLTYSVYHLVSIPSAGAVLHMATYLGAILAPILMLLAFSSARFVQVAFVGLLSFPIFMYFLTIKA